MSTMRDSEMRSRHAAVNRWATPLFGLAFGLVVFALVGSRGEWGLAVALLAIMLGYSGILAFLGRRSETIGLLGGDAQDERGLHIQDRAVVATAYVLIVVVIGMFVWELARGEDGQPWSYLGLIGGVTFVVATAILAKRS